MEICKVERDKEQHLTVITIPDTDIPMDVNITQEGVTVLDAQIGEDGIQRQE